MEEAYKEITDDKVQSWEKVLLDNRLKSRALINDDAMLLNVSLDQLNQKVIKNDCIRTRAMERLPQSSFVDYSERLLTYYCAENKIKYKQGLNELIGPFVLLKSKCSLTFSRIYNMFTCFIDRHLTNYYNEEEFYSLQSSLLLLTLLLKYHAPSLLLLFEASLITPEMYATSWILTGFANKMKLEVIYHIWDKLILFNDPLLMHFMCVALLIHNKKQLEAIESAQVPSVLCQLSIVSKTDADDIIHSAFDLINTTPSSFRLLADQLELFRHQSTKAKKLFQGFAIESMLSLPMFPSEGISIAYKEDFNCSDEHCKVYSAHFQKVMNKECSYCVNRTELPFLLIDIRFKGLHNNTPIRDISNCEEAISSCGYLQRSTFPIESGISDEDFEAKLILQIKKEVTERTMTTKEDVHIIFLTSRTDYFKPSKSKWYQEIITESEIIKRKKSTLLKFKTVNTSQSKRLESLIHIKEYYRLKRIIQALQKENYKYVSYVYGGYKELHELALFYEQPLESHGQQCYWCSKTKAKKSLFSSLNTYFKRNNKEGNGTVKLCLSAEEIGELAVDVKNTVFNCLLHEKNDHSSTLILFLSKHGIAMYKERKSIVDCKDHSTFLLVVYLLHSSIEDIQRDKAISEQLLITFTANSKGQQLMLSIDFISNEKLCKFLIQRNNLIKKSSQ